MKRRAALFGRIVFFSVGAVVLVVIIRTIGIHEILANIASIGWRFVPIFAVNFIWYCCYTLGWEEFLRGMSGELPFWSLFRIKIAGEAVNTMTPANFVGGDPMRIFLLKTAYPVTEGAASVVVDRTIHSMATLLVVAIGIIATFLTVGGLPENIKYGVPIVMVIAIIFIGFIFFHQRRGIFGILVSGLKKFGIKREFSEATVARFEELDQHIVTFYQKNQRNFWRALSYHTFGRLLGVIEIYIVGHAVADQFTLFTALVLTALAPMINALFTFIPGALGVLEGAYSGVLYLMGFDPLIGITIQIAKRLRAVFWIGLGLLFLSTRERKQVWQEKLIEEV